jgi:hypothetical protein
MKKWLRLLISAIFAISGSILLFFIFLNPETSTIHYEDFSWVKYFFSIALILILFYTAFFVLIRKVGSNDNYYYDQEHEKEGTYDKLYDTEPIKVMNRWISGRGGDDFKKR